jgi:hypothetical protein
MKTFRVVALLLLLAPAEIKALGPHEVLVLANVQSPDSIEIAEEFVRLRRIPRINIVRLTVPMPKNSSPVRITPDQFTTLIWTPAVRAMKTKRIDDHILAWVYSVDFPVMVTSDPPVSVQGLTFLRNVLPDRPESIEKGTYVSPLFTGPNNPTGPVHFSQTLDVYREWLGADMPLPSMALGFIGERGNTRQTVLDCLAQGIASDNASPTGTVYLITDNGVRSECRDWQFPFARKALGRLGINSEITDEFPVQRTDILGLMMGAAEVDPHRQTRYLPGSMAEHLTSAAAVFETANQTKMSEWIKAGVTASAGAVTEPRAIWTKFPSAFFFVHYGSGCTMIESFFQSIRCPLQIFLAGDPLASPWASDAKLAIVGLKDEVVSGTQELQIDVTTGADDYYGRFVVLLDGRIIGSGRTLKLDTTGMENGTHVLRAVAYSTGFIRNQVFTEETIIVKNE